MVHTPMDLQHISATMEICWYGPSLCFGLTVGQNSCVDLRDRGNVSENFSLGHADPEIGIAAAHTDVRIALGRGAEIINGTYHVHAMHSCELYMSRK